MDYILENLDDYKLANQEYSLKLEYTYTWEHEDLNGNTTTFPSTWIYENPRIKLNLLGKMDM